MGHCHGNCLLPFSRQRSDAQYPAADRALPERYDSVHATPLLCAGLIGFRAWRLAGKASPRRLRLYGFGAAAHLICQIAVFQGQEVYAFTRPGDTAGQDFARSLGTVWAGARTSCRCRVHTSRFLPWGKPMPRCRRHGQRCGSPGALRTWPTCEISSPGPNRRPILKSRFVVRGETRSPAARPHSKTACAQARRHRNPALPDLFFNSTQGEPS